MWTRVGYAVVGGILAAAAFVAVIVAFAAFDRCGWDWTLFLSGVGVVFLSPVGLFGVGLGAVNGYSTGRKSLLVAGSILAIALLAIGTTQAIPNFNQPDAPRCEMHL